MTRRRGESIPEWIARTNAHLETVMAAPHYVYRAFDSYGILLYVGCTKNVDQRLSAHRNQAPWTRFCETVGVSGPYDGRDAGREAEMQAILSEGAYFNSTPDDIKRTQANRNAAKRAMFRRGWFEPRVPDDIDAREDWQAFREAHDAIEPEAAAWRRGLDREIARLKARTHPYMTDEDRMQAYLAARQDAELARQEAAA